MTLNGIIYLGLQTLAVRARVPTPRAVVGVVHARPARQLFAAQSGKIMLHSLWRANVKGLLVVIVDGFTATENPGRKKKKKKKKMHEK